MEIKSTFDVHNFAKYKFDNNKNAKRCLEIVEVITQTCYAGTQVFYKCREIFATKKFEKIYDEKSAFTWEVAHGINYG